MYLEYLEGTNVPSFIIDKVEELRAREVVEDVLKDQKDLFLVDLKLKGAIGNRKLLIFIDGDEGFSIDRCGRISKAIGLTLEERDIVEGKYTLEVSSPGLDFPLMNSRQYKKNIGRTLTIKLKAGEAFEGELIAVSEIGLSLNHTHQHQDISWDEIEESKIKISFK